MPSCGDGSATHSRPRARTRSPGAKFTVIAAVSQNIEISASGTPAAAVSGSSNSVQPLASAASRAALASGATLAATK